MRKISALLLIMYVFSSCSGITIQDKNDFVIARGQMPDLVIDKDENVHLVYGNGDSIMYVYSTNHATTFSKPAVVAVLPHAYTFAMRGPQIAATGTGVVVTACTSAGTIYSFHKKAGSDWAAGEKVNDMDTIAKEGLMGLSASGEHVFAVWLDVRGNKRNKIYGAASDDGGKTWLANKMIYTSPDSTVCECCKPSVVMQAHNVYVMFRNLLQGNRDMYLIQSTDGGNKFGQATKLGTGNWKLDGCPMDGGALTVTKIGTVQTVWSREGKIYTAQPGMPQQEIGTGKGCKMETANGEIVYAWTENGKIAVLKPQGKKKIIGTGNQLVLKALNNQSMLCVWENDKQLHASIFAL